mgnify:CR=1 FL=1
MKNQITYRKIIPAKITEKRGKRSRREIVEASGGKFTEMDLYSYEKKKHNIPQDKVPFLLVALGATFEEISEPVTVTTA